MHFVKHLPLQFSCFSSAARRWVPVISRPVLRSAAAAAAAAKSQAAVYSQRNSTDTFSLVSWNIDFASSHAIRRCASLIDHVLQDSLPDIICLQEVRSDVRNSLLRHHQLRQAFLLAGADTCRNDREYTTVTLLCKQRFAYDLDAEHTVANEGKYIVGPVFRTPLPTQMGRDGLAVDLIAPHAPACFLRIINVHLESCDAFSYRAKQLKRLASLLQVPGCIGGVLVGDFNSTTIEDHQLLENNQLEDAWLMLHGDTNPNMPIWRARRNYQSGTHHRHDPARIDKVAMVGVKAERMEVMRPGVIEVPRPGASSDMIEWSDHSGLQCHFSL